MQPDASQAADTMIVVAGVVESGDQRGRTLGFPTANIALLDQAGAVGDGVWAGWVERTRGGEVAHIPAAVSVGRRPTYYGDNGYRLVEAYLLDFDGDLYGEVLTVSLARRLRAQQAYPSAQALIDALGNDVAATRAWAEHAPTPGSGTAGDELPRNVPVRFPVKLGNS